MRTSGRDPSSGDVSVSLPGWNPVLFGMRASALVVAIAAFPVDVGCSQSCTSSGCENGVSFKYPIEPAPSDLTTLRITLCRNSDCKSGSPTEQAGRGVGVSCGLPDAVHSRCYLTIDDAGRLILEGKIDPYADSSSLHDGDVVTVEVVKTPPGLPLLQVTATVTYRESWVNGKECDAEPCRSARIP